MRVKPGQVRLWESCNELFLVIRIEPDPRIKGVQRVIYLESGLIGSDRLEWVETRSEVINED